MWLPWGIALKNLVLYSRHINAPPQGDLFSGVVSLWVAFVWLSWRCYKRLDLQTRQSIGVISCRTCPAAGDNCMAVEEPGEIGCSRGVRFVLLRGLAISGALRSCVAWKFVVYGIRSRSAISSH